MTTRICFMCRDNYDDLYKICTCFDSVLCRECLLITNNTNMSRCPICRRNLKIKFIINKFTIASEIMKKIFFTIFYFGMSLSYPIYSYVKYKDKYHIYLFFSMLFINLFVDRIIIKKMSQELIVQDRSIYITKFAIGYLTLLSIFFMSKYLADLMYFLVFIFLFYLLPITLISVFNYLDELKEVKEFIKNKSRTKFINYELISNLSI